MPTSYEPRRSTRDIAILALLLLAASYALLPGIDGYFVTDDSIFLATARLTESPWLAFVQHHFYDPLYHRPFGSLLWSLSYMIAGTDYRAHALLSLAIHLINVVLLWWLCSRLTKSLAVLTLAVALFAIGPWSTTVPLWLSNRFDLLATFGVLVAMLSIVRKDTALSSKRFSAQEITRLLQLAIATIFACWSKEWAYSLFAAFCFALTVWRRSLGSSFVHPSRSAAVIALALMLATITRLLIIDPAGNKTSLGLASVGNVANGLALIASAFLRLSNAYDTFVVSIVFLTLIAIPCLGVLTTARVKGSSARTPLAHVRAGAVVFVFLVAATFVPQSLTFGVYASLIESSVFGAVSSTRFFYGATAISAIAVAAWCPTALPQRILNPMLFFSALIVIALLALKLHSVSARYAAWAQSEIAPFVRNAALAAERTAAEGGQSCTVVLIGTQIRNPWFRMFSDTSVKMLFPASSPVWNCQILTESTPWLFISHADRPLPEIGLNRAPIDAQGTPKPDYVWGGVRYRYRLIATDLSKLPDARFFEWNGSTFNEITEAVKSGNKTVKAHGWGF